MFSILRNAAYNHEKSLRWEFKCYWLHEIDQIYINFLMWRLKYILLVTVIERNIKYILVNLFFPTICNIK